MAGPVFMLNLPDRGARPGLVGAALRCYFWLTSILFLADINQLLVAGERLGNRLFEAGVGGGARTLGLTDIALQKRPVGVWTVLWSDVELRDSARHEMAVDRAADKL